MIRLNIGPLKTKYIYIFYRVIPTIQYNTK